MKQIKLHLLFCVSQWAFSLFFFFSPLEYQEKRTLFPRAYSYTCARIWSNPKWGALIPIRPLGTDEIRAFCEDPIFVLGEIRDPAALPPPSDTDRWHMDSQPHPPTAIMETHLSCKLICNYDFGKCSKETQKGLIEWHFPMSLSPDKWDKTLQMCSGPRQHRRGCCLRVWRVLTCEV